MFGEMLQLDRVGVFDSFFRLGGKSLGAARVLSRIAARYGLEIGAKDFFAAPTVAATAETIAHLTLERGSAPDLGSLLDQVEAMSEEEALQRLKSGPDGPAKAGAD